MSGSYESLKTERCILVQVLDVAPLKCMYGGFMLSWPSWVRTKSRYPALTFDQYFDYKVRKCNGRDRDSERFWKNFDSSILRERALRREIRRIQRDDVSPARGLQEPKPEPVDEVLDEDSALRFGSFCAMAKDGILRYPEVKEEPEDVPDYDEGFLNLLHNLK
jgi:hypothetical protein